MACVGVTQLTGKVTQDGLLRLQEMVLGCEVALQKWDSVMQHLVKAPAARLVIKRKLDRLEFASAVSDTLHEWESGQTHAVTVADFNSILRRYELNYLVRKIEEDFAQERGKEVCLRPSNPVEGFWYGVSDLVDNFVGREAELDRLHMLVTENHFVNSSSSYALLTSVHGLGGIGKTTLARKYAWVYKDFFEGNVIWIDAESTKTMRHSFTTCARTLGHNLGQDLDIRSLAELVYKTFTNRKFLLIFDNADSYDGPNGVKQFLPDGLLHKPYLLLTSRRNDIARADRSLDLDVFTLEDSVKILESIPNVNRDACVQLCERLDRFPLAIQQARSYIVNTIDLYEDRSSAIKLYLEAFNQNTNEMLDKGFLDPTGYTKTVAVTWIITLKKIASLRHGWLAHEILKHLAYLYPDNIKLELLKMVSFKYKATLSDKFPLPLCINIEREYAEVTDLDAKCVMSAVGLLKLYSMISLSFGTIKVHRLVQEVVKPEGWEEPFIIKRLAHTLDALYSTGKLSDQCILHAQTLLPLAITHPILMKFPVFLNTKLQYEFSLSLRKLPGGTPELVGRLLKFCSSYSERLTYNILQSMTLENPDEFTRYVETCEKLWQSLNSIASPVSLDSISCLMNFIFYCYIGTATKYQLLIFEYMLYAGDERGRLVSSKFAAHTPAAITALNETGIIRRKVQWTEDTEYFLLFKFENYQSKAKFFDVILEKSRALHQESARLRERDPEALYFYSHKRPTGKFKSQGLIW